MKVFKDNAGISLIWVLILIVVVGVLSATLLTASNFNLRFGIDEVDTSRAFYAADAGVQLVYSERSQIFDEFIFGDDEGKFISYNNSKGNIVFDNDYNEFNLEENGDINFNVKAVSSAVNSNGIINKTILFESEGKTRDANRIIRFNLRKNVLPEFDKPFNIKSKCYDNDNNYDFNEEDYYELAGNGGNNGDNIEEYINVEKELWQCDMTWKDFWEPYADLENIEYLYGDYKVDSDIEKANKKILNGDFSIGGNDSVKNSVFVVGGNFKLSGNPVIEESLFVIKGFVEIDGGGGPSHKNFTNSVFLIYGDEEYEENGSYLFDAGTPSTSVDFPEEGHSPGITGLINIENWREFWREL